ncbi:beta-ketoacyl-ACP reductase [Ureibacillus thermosphaericus]|uniref:beta-ketoacyl-ACP reductase n=1 Tax=Ureibacillus thermosphaericus TaxID=51173 RepID=UPI0030C9010C
MTTTVFEVEQVNSLKPLEGKVAIVTGASRGIGAEIAKVLARNGATVIGTYNNSPKQIEDVAKVIEEEGGKFHALQADVSVFDDTEKLAAEVKEKFGKIDILINNAGITKDRTFKNMSKEDWDAVINVNLNGVFNATKSVIQHMLEQNDGRIVTISSIVGQAGAFGQTNYSATKAGILGFTKSLALETASKGITVNAVCPGYIGTEMVAAMPEKVLNNIVEKVPMKRLGLPSEVAQAVLYLVQADYVTGQAIAVNGGLYM